MSSVRRSRHRGGSRGGSNRVRPHYTGRMSLVLAVDIGGTSSRFAFFERDAMLWSRAWRSRDHAGVEELVTRALEESRLHPAAACVGVAGPVVDGTCRVTNLPWTVDARAIAKAAHLARERVALINDVEAAARGIDALAPEDCV